MPDLLNVEDLEPKKTILNVELSTNGLIQKIGSRAETQYIWDFQEFILKI